MSDKEIEDFFDELDQFLSEHVIDPCGYDPKSETRKDLITMIYSNSEDNQRMLIRLRAKRTDKNSLISEVEAIKVIETFNIHTCGLIIRDAKNISKTILGHDLKSPIGERLYNLLMIKYQSSFPS